MILTQMLFNVSNKIVLDGDVSYFTRNASSSGDYGRHPNIKMGKSNKFLYAD